MLPGGSPIDSTREGLEPADVGHRELCECGAEFFESGSVETACRLRSR